ncbi:MAG: T9SS type A sorting domain-containing protein [Saprospiraceae bacterium]|nr:T9SS type A sorting domain-containing protein [Saprospiraceae bacterium]
MCITSDRYITINARPVVTIASTSICIGATTALTPSTGGTWVSSNTAVATVTNAGVVSGVSAGTATFTFTSTSTGCSSLPTGAVNVSACSGTLLGAYYFESGWQSWTDGGTDCARYIGTNSYEGSYSISIRDNTSTSVMTSPALNVSTFTKLTVDFWFYATSMDAGEDFWLQYYNGSTWSTVGSWTVGTNFSNNVFTNRVATVLKVNYAFPVNAKFRFVCDASDDDDVVYIDKVIVTGETISGRGNHDVIPEDFATHYANDFVIYPNPASDYINIGYQVTKSPNEEHSMILLQLFDTSGKMVSEKLYNSNEGKITHPVDLLKSGLYIIKLSTKGKFLHNNKIHIMK